MNICFSLAVPLNGVDQKTNDDKKKVEIIKTIEEVDNNNNEDIRILNISFIQNYLSSHSVVGRFHFSH